MSEETLYYVNKNIYGLGTIEASNLILTNPYTFSRDGISLSNLTLDWLLIDNIASSPLHYPLQINATSLQQPIVDIKLYNFNNNQYSGGDGSIFKVLPFPDTAGTGHIVGPYNCNAICLQINSNNFIDYYMNITCANITTQNNNINAGSGAITSGLLSTKQVLVNATSIQQPIISVKVPGFNNLKNPSGDGSVFSVLPFPLTLNGHIVGPYNCNAICLQVNSNNFIDYYMNITCGNITTQNHTLNTGSGGITCGNIITQNHTLNTGSGGITCGTIITNNNVINTGSGGITCGTITTKNNIINAGSGAITCGIITTQNNAINTGSGAITCGIITTQNNAINTGSGAITCGTIITNNNIINTGSGAITCGTIITNNNIINTGSGAITCGIITTQNNAINTGSGAITCGIITTQNNEINAGSGTIIAANFNGNATSATSANSATYAGYATSTNSATYASYATSTNSAINAGYATSTNLATYADYATTAGSVLGGAINGTANSATYASYATSASTASTATTASIASTATNATNAVVARTANSASYANSAVSANSARYAGFAINATNASNAIYTQTATNATNAIYAQTSGTALSVTAGISNIVFGQGYGLKFGTNYIAEDFSDSDEETLPVSAMYIQSISRNIGIGTTTPSVELDLWGKFTVHSKTTNTASFIITNDTGATNITCAGTLNTSTLNTQYMKNTTVGMSNIIINSALLVHGYDDSYYNQIQYPEETTIIGADPSTLDTQLQHISIRADYAVFASCLLTPSDKRIKDNLEALSSSNSLSKLLDLQVYSYNLLSEKNRLSEGFIAQEVAEILPNAVSNTTHAIPSIMKYVQRVPTTLNQVYLEVDGDLQPFDYVKLLINNATETFQVDSVTSTTVTFTRYILPADAKIYVYGKYVNDFKVIAYEKIIPIVCSATQELHSIIQRQQKQLDDILQRLERLEAK
jgi:hypothetical protein